MKKIKKYLYDKRIVLILSVIHYVVSYILSIEFFVPLKENIGKETFAYRFFATGATMETDTISTVLCWMYSHILALGFIYLFWSWLFFMISSWKNKLETRKYIITLCLLIVLGVLTIIGLYPSVISHTPDTRYNYIYARVWMPMYWHGFLTNVFHCACLFVFPHPISMSIIPLFFGINIFFYFTYHTLAEKCKYGYLCTIVLAAVFMMMPETIEILTYVGRNYAYPILSVAYVGTILKDYLENRKLTKAKFVGIGFMTVCLATWRSEGILYLVFFPFLLYFAYFYGRTNICENNCLRNVVRAVLCIGAMYLIMSLPGKYGNEKYQDYDYFIINTPGPLSAVWANEGMNTDYEEYDDDVAVVNSVIPIEYIQKYGEYASAYYNVDNLRSTRQCDVGKQVGRDYAKAAYRILLYNCDIYFKYQINLYLSSIGFPKQFEIDTVRAAEWVKSEEVQALSDWISDYTWTGQADVENEHRVILVNEEIDSVFKNKVTQVREKLYNFEMNYSGIFKVLITVITVLITLMSVFRKEWLYAFMGMLILGIMFIVIFAAPSARANYFYSSYYNQYWFILFWVIQNRECRGIGRTKNEEC